MNYSLKRPSRLLALLSLAAFSCAALPAQDWLVVDTFAGGAPQGDWTFSGGFAREVRSSDAGYSLFTTSGSGNTEKASVVLPQTVTSGKVTIAFDFFAPGGRSLNQVGFGAGSAAMVARAGWLAVGTNNRFQMVDRTAGATEFLDKIPQFLAKAGDWTIDTLDPTLQGFWYNMWIVYDLGAGQFSLYARRADAESQNAVHRGTWSFIGATFGEDYSEISRFALGAGGSGNPDAPALGGQFANIYMAVGENLSLTPTAIVLDPPSWQAIDTFAGATPNATWMGDLDKFNLDFSEGYLQMLPTPQTGSPRGESIYTELPQNVEFGVFTVTFDFFINGPSGSRSDVSFAAVGDAQIALSDWGRRGGNTRLGTFGGTPQAFRAFTPPQTIAIPGADVAGQWYHAWIVYNLSEQRIDFRYAPFGSLPASESPAASWSFDTANVDYSNFRYFVVGLDRPTSAGLRLGNLYFAQDELITLSPTAGTFSPDAGWMPGVFYSTPLLGEIYSFGNDWAQWYPLVGLYVDFGSIWVAELGPQSTAGWFYHAQGQSWFYGVTNGASTDLYAWVDRLGQWIYINMAASEGAYYLFADPAVPSSARGWFAWGEGPIF